MAVLSLIVAMDEGGLIGRENGLPWRLPDDLAFFKRTTMGKPVIMGRKTYESIGKPLPGRENIVISRQADYRAPGCTVVGGIEEISTNNTDADELMIMGGSQIYSQSLPLACRLYVTRIHSRFEGDAWFPEVEWSNWSKVRTEYVPADQNNLYRHSFELWVRKS